MLQFYCKYRLPGCARRPQHRETSIAFFSDSPLIEMNHFCSKRLIYGSIFIRLAVVCSQIREIPREFEVITGQGHPREKLHNPNFNRFWLIHQCDRRKDGRTIAYSALSILCCRALKKTSRTLYSVDCSQRDATAIPCYKLLDVDVSFRLTTAELGQSRSHRESLTKDVSAVTFDDEVSKLVRQATVAESQNIHCGP